MFATLSRKRERESARVESLARLITPIQLSNSRSRSRGANASELCPYRPQSEATIRRETPGLAIAP